MGFTHLQIEQNPWLWGCRPQIPVLSALCPQLNLLNPPPRTKFLDTPLNTGTETTFKVSGARDSRNVKVTGLTRNFIYSMGLQPAGITRNSLAGDAHIIFQRTTRKPGHNNGCGPLP
jgi:hypothetical protein